MSERSAENASEGEGLMEWFSQVEGDEFVGMVADNGEVPLSFEL